MSRSLANLTKKAYLPNGILIGSVVLRSAPACPTHWPRHTRTHQYETSHNKLHFTHVNTRPGQRSQGVNYGIDYRMTLLKLPSFICFRKKVKNVSYFKSDVIFFEIQYFDKMIIKTNLNTNIVFLQFLCFWYVSMLVVLLVL